MNDEIRDDWNSRSGSPRVLPVRWLWNPGQHPRPFMENHEENGVITDVRPMRTSDEAHALAVIAVPPLVNAHTHLEFSRLTDPLGPSLPFPAWIESVLRYRESEVDHESSSVEGMRECSRAGIHFVADTVTHDVTSDRRGPGCLMFREVIGLTSERIEQSLSQVRRFLVSPVRFKGVSPHAPYTVHPDLLNHLTDLAWANGIPVSMHLAETQAEIELLHSGTGPFATLLQRRGIFDPSLFPGHRTVLDMLKILSRAPMVLSIHGNYYTSEEIRFLGSQPQIATVYCPRTHTFFGHRPHPIERLTEAGATVLLGTDSRASNPDLSIWRELQCVVRKHTEIPVQTTIGMISTHAAEAMGVTEWSRPIATGESCSATLISCDRSDSFGEAVLSDACFPLATLVRGQFHMCTDA